MSEGGGTSLRLEHAGARGAIVVLHLDRPATRNAIDNDVLGRLLVALAGIAADPAAIGCVITGSGGAFSSGMDLKERAAFSDDDLRAQRAGIVELITAVHELPVPVVAAVEGPAFAGGFELALACDLVVAGSSAVFALPEVGVGIFPGGGATSTLTWLVGPARARDVILTGRRLTAAEAAQWGIVARVVEDGSALAAAVGLVETICEGAPLAVRQVRAGIRAANRALADAMADEDLRYETVLESDDRREGFRAFTEKRPPRFTGR
jgi:enoyl-CoA hydratase/carnithine racemase